MKHVLRSGIRTLAGGSVLPRVVFLASLFLLMSLKGWGQLTGSVTGPANVCQGSSAEVTFSGSGGTIPYTFTYTINGGDELTIITSGANTSVNLTVDTNTPGTYTYVLIKITDSTPESQDLSSSTEVVVHPVPGAITTEVTQPTCAVTQGTIVITSPLTEPEGAVIEYSIDGTTWSTTTTYSGLDPGAYTVIARYVSDPTCESTLSVTLNEAPTTPSAPVVGTISQPTCSVATGSVELSGLPTGTWILNPGNISGNTTEYTVSGLSAGTYTFTVTNAEGCPSPASEDVVIEAQPSSPPVPVAVVNCDLGFPDGIVSVLSPLGDQYEYRLNDGAYQSSTLFANVVNGSYTVTVRNTDGCETTGESFDVSCDCINGPTLTLSSTSGATCGTTPITVSDNVFGGTATNVTITTDGAGVVDPISTNSTPFSFTYTPGTEDIGGTVIITVTTNNPLGEPCVAATAIYTLTVNTIPVITGTTDASRCGPGTVILEAVASGGTINWYAELTGGEPLASGTSFTTPVINVTTTYYVDATENGCTTSERSPVIAEVIQFPEPAGPITGPSTYTPGTSGIAYSVSPITGATSYVWSYSGTGVTINGEGDNVTLDFAIDATSGQLSVRGRNDCGDGAESSIELTPSTKTLTLTSVLLEGLYSGGGVMNQAYNEFGPQWAAGIADQITIELHEGTSYGTITWSQTGVELSTSGTAVVSVPGEYSGSYYITIRHRNSLETTTAVPVSFAGSTIEHSFGSRDDVYGGNLGTTFDGRFVIYAGDVNQDGFIDTQDFVDIDNDSYNYASGYLTTDIDGNGMVDTNDFLFIDNNNYNYIGVILPPTGIAINIMKSIQTDKKTVNDQNITTEYEKGF